MPIVKASRDNIVQIAQSYINVPFKHQGRNRRGLDCVGLLVCVASYLKLSDYDIYDYSRIPRNFDLLQHIERAGAVKISPMLYKHGSFMVFRARRLPMHVAIVSNKNNQRDIIHVYYPRGKVVKEPLGEWWKDRIVGAFDFPGIE